MLNIATIENMSRPPRIHLRSMKWPAPGMSQPVMSTITGKEEDCAGRACAETSVAIADLMITGWKSGKDKSRKDALKREILFDSKRTHI
jgi:hypothetical protein